MSVATVADWLVPDAWLGERLERPAFRVLPERLEPALTTEPRRAADVLESLGDAFVYARVPTARADLVADLQRLRFLVVDTSVVFARAPGPAPPTPAATRAAQPGDEDAVAELAGGSFAFSRFHLDPRIGRPAADRIKRDWVRGYFAGRRGDAMLVAEREGVVAGFVLLLTSGEARVIDLIAVAAGHRGRGIGSALIAGAVRAASGSARLEVGTQVANVPSVRLYEREGFRLVRSSYVLHRHGG